MSHINHRKITFFLAVILLFFSISPLQANAIDIDPETPVSPIDPVSPYVNLYTFNAYLAINDSGKAICEASARTRNSTYKISLTITLQQYYSGSWHYVTAWSTTSTGSASLSRSYYVASGYYYRVKAYAYVTTSGGSYIENPTIYSGNYYY